MGDPFKMGTIVPAAMLVAVLMGMSVATAQHKNNDFKWPEPVVFLEPEWDVRQNGILGVKAVVPEHVRERIVRQTYTPEERKIVQRAIEEKANPRRIPMLRAKDYKPTLGPGGFYPLHTVFVHQFGLKPHSNDGYAVYSFMGRVETIEDIIVKGNRAVAPFRITGSVAGPMFGFKGNGQLIDIREQLIFNFNEQGEVSYYLPWSGDDMLLYEQLGGTWKTDGTPGVMPTKISSPTIPGTPSPPSSAAEVKAMVDAGDYSADERRNIQTLLDVLARREGLESPGGPYFCKGYVNKYTNANVTPFAAASTSPYAALERAFGQPNGFRVNAFKDLKRQVLDIIAKGDRLWVHVVSTGQHTGPLFGVPGSGKTLTWNEQAFVTFDQAGKICETIRHPTQSELYLQLGGQYTFPYGKYWKCDGCPGNPGIATLNIPSESD